MRPGFLNKLSTLSCSSRGPCLRFVESRPRQGLQACHLPPLRAEIHRPARVALPVLPVLPILPVSLEHACWLQGALASWLAWVRGLWDEMRWILQGARANRSRSSASAEDERWTWSPCKGSPWGPGRLERGLTKIATYSGPAVGSRALRCAGATAEPRCDSGAESGPRARDSRDWTRGMGDGRWEMGDRPYANNMLLCCARCCARCLGSCQRGYTRQPCRGRGTGPGKDGRR